MVSERNKSLEEKERSIVELRNNNRTLENFRYVLDHRLKQLMEERCESIRDGVERKRDPSLPDSVLFLDNSAVDFVLAGVR